MASFPNITMFKPGTYKAWAALREGRLCFSQHSPWLKSHGFVHLSRPASLNLNSFFLAHLSFSYKSKFNFIHTWHYFRKGSIFAKAALLYLRGWKVPSPWPLTLNGQSHDCIENQTLLQFCLIVYNIYSIYYSFPCFNLIVKSNLVIRPLWTSNKLELMDKIPDESIWKYSKRVQFSVLHDLTRDLAIWSCHSERQALPRWDCNRFWCQLLLNALLPLFISGWDKKLQHQKAIKMTAHQSRRCRANLSSPEPSISDKYSKNTVGLPFPPHLITMLASHLCDSLYSPSNPPTSSFCIISSLKVVVVQHRSVNWFSNHNQSYHE